MQTESAAHESTTTLALVRELTAQRDAAQGVREWDRTYRAALGPETDWESFLLVAEPPAPAAAARPAQLGLLPAADSTVAATGLLF